MKVHDIRSFFNKPPAGTGNNNDREESVTPSSPELVDVPTKRRNVGEKDKNGKRSKNKEDDVLRGRKVESESDEDPLPRSSRSRKPEKKENKSIKKNVAVSSSDEEDPLPKSVRKKVSTKSEGQRKRKAKVLSDSEEEDFKVQKTASTIKSQPSEKPTKKVPKIEEKAKSNIKPDDFFSSEPMNRQKTNKQETNTSQAVMKTDKRRIIVNNKSPKKLNASEEKKRSSSSSLTSTEKVTSTNRTSTSTSSTTSNNQNSPSKDNLNKREKSSKKSSASSTSKEFKAPPTPKTKTNDKMKEGRGIKRPVQKSISDDEDDNFDPKAKAKRPSTTKRNKTPVKHDSDELDAKPIKTPEEKKKIQMENYSKFLARSNAKPRNLGLKEIPEGAPNCLEKMIFVITGTLDSLERDACKDIVEQYGGKVTTSVSRKTTYLIVGDDPGNSKTSKAKQFNIPQITEDGFLEIIRKSNPNPQSSFEMQSFDESEEENENDQSVFESSNVSEKLNEMSSTKSSRSHPTDVLDDTLKTQQEKPTSSTSKPSSGVIAISDPGLMWVDKYKPKTMKQIVGQTKDSSNARKLIRWLQNWFKNHPSSKEKAKAAYPGLKDPEGKTFKCALLSGPPGIGKTTTAHLACKEVGYDFYELNASDTRSKKGLHEKVSVALTNQCLFRGVNQDQQLTNQHVLIMDEVDGMSGNEDRGGVQELIALIKASRTPIICICNDRNHQKIRSLSNYCFDLRFQKPTIQELKGFVSGICFKEKLKVDPQKMLQLMISTDQDIRQILHQLQLFKDNTTAISNPKKDLRFGPWDVCRKVFFKPEHDSLNIHEKTGLFFQDYSFGPLFVQENYLKQNPVAAGGDRFKKLDLISKSAAAIAEGDLIDSLIRRTNNWGMLPVQAVFSSYIPGEYMESNVIGPIDFPKWLGKNSNKGKRHRLLQSLHTHVHLQVSGSLEALNMDYLPYLRRAIVKPLVSSNYEMSAKIMEAYALIRDDFDSINELALWPGMKNPMDSIDSRIKASFTRLVNKEILPYSNAKVVKGKGRAKPDELEEFDDESADNAEPEEEEDESLEKDAMIKMKTRKATASSSKDKQKKNSKDVKPSTSKASSSKRSRKK